MTIYYLTIATLAGLGYALTDRNKQAAHKKMENSRACAFHLSISFLLLVFLSSCRYAIGFDYFSYRNIYEITSELTYADILRLHPDEPLFFLTCKLLGTLGCPYQILLLIINVFLLAVAMFFIRRYSKIPWVSVYLYITLQFLAYNMNLIRQSIATAFFLLAFPYLKNRKLLPFTTLIFTGGLFHNSLLFLFPLYFLLPQKQTKKSLLALAALTTIIYIFFEPLFGLIKPFLPFRYANYQGGYFWHPNGLQYVIFPAFYCILILLFRNCIKDSLLRSVCINSAIYHFIISLFITKHFILERFAVYPFAFSLIAIPEIIYSYEKKEHDGKPFWTYHRVLLLFLLFGGAYFAFAALFGFHHVYPYTGLWNKSISSPR
ncbi:MAG: EpsG family protein [Lachnospiraceae bacterium]|nr:EpsG family protein [Lachnospiraceae bacterium]